MGILTGTKASDAVKYHLVEAEEVNYKPQVHSIQSTYGGLNSKRKGKLHWSQFPMENDENLGLNGKKSNELMATTRTVSVSQTQRHGEKMKQSESRQKWGCRNGGMLERRRESEETSGCYYNGVYIPTPDVKLTAQWAKNQIEFYFTSDNLVRDILMRQHMDVDGYVPLAFVGSFQAVYSVHQDYKSLLEAMKDSETIELDERNEKIRLRQGWEKWVWPNADGGYGVPRYIKQTDVVKTA